MKKHFVVFFSPGTFVHEESERPIYSWDVPKACEIAHEIVERYGATPFAFQFTTRERKSSELDSRITKRSKTYFLGGEIRLLEEIIAENDKKNSILITNMRCNHWDRILVNTNSWKITAPFKEGDVLLDWTPKTKAIA